MEEYKDRLAQAMGGAPVPRTVVVKLAAHLEITPQAVQKVLDGKSKGLTAQNNAKAAAYLTVNSDWLAVGAGEMRGKVGWPFPLLTPSLLAQINPEHVAAAEKMLLALVSSQSTVLGGSRIDPDTTEAVSSIKGKQWTRTQAGRERSKVEKATQPAGKRRRAGEK